jgi:hypothetical protein
MRSARRFLGLLALGALLVIALLGGCSKFDPGDPNPNKSPETTLSFSPDEGDTANFEVRMNWFGWDVDGKIDYYQTAWDWPDSIVDPVEGVDWDEVDWRNVISTDSVFYVRASAETVTTTKGFQEHRFAVRAVDDEGAWDLTPEQVAFTAFTFVPDTEILRGPSTVTGTMVSFEWTASDRDGVIVAYQYRLSRFEDDEWFPVVESDTLSNEDTEVIFGPITGKHRFEVWAIDDAGAFDRTPATRTFTCNPDLALGPKLFLRSNVFGLFSFRGPVVPTEFNVPEPIFLGERLSFEWTATAESYGGEVVGYRHAYDDTTIWPAWSVFDRVFSVNPDVGVHSLFVQAIDNANAVTRGRLTLEVVEASLDDYILIVDDYDLNEGGLAMWGTDEARDLFYFELTAPFERERFVWTPSQQLEDNLPQPPDVEALANASTVIWYADGQPISDPALAPVLWRTFHASDVIYNALAGYVRVGGNLVLCGYKGIGTIADVATYTPQSDDGAIEVAAGDTLQNMRFIRDFLHVGSALNSGNLSNKDAPYQYGYCFHGAEPTAEGAALGFSGVYIDSVGSSGWPSRGKWPLYTNPQYAYKRCGLPQVERVDPYLGSAVTIFEMESFVNSQFQDVPCGQLYLSGTNHGNVGYFGFPFYYLQTDDARDLVDRLLSYMGEPKLGAE